MTIRRFKALITLLLNLLLLGAAIGSETAIRHEYSDPAITWIEYEGQTEKLDNALKPTLVIPQGVTTHVVVENPNPFLLLYSASDVRLIDMPDVAALKKFGEAISGVLNQLDVAVSVEKDAIFAMTTAERRGQQRLPICEIYYDDQPIGEAIQVVRSGIEAYIDLPTRIDSTLRSGRLDATNLRVEADVIEKLKTVIGSLETARSDLLRTNTIGLLAVLTEPLSNGSVRTTRTAFVLEWSDLDNPDFAKHCVGSNSSNIEALVSAWRVFWELRVDLERWKAVAKTLEQFNADASAAEERIVLRDEKLDQVKFVSTWSKKVEANVLLKANPFWSALLSEQAKKVQAQLMGAEDSVAAASYPIVLAPERFFHFAISPGLVYSFVNQPRFSVADDGAGAFTIRETEEDSGEIEGAVALNIYPDRFFAQEIKPFVQVGITPGDDTAFLLGVGARLGGAITLAIGAAYQEVDELRGGQHVGDTIASEDALSVGDDYDTGFYINVSYDVDLF